jgi:hypothetical protein
VGVHDSWLQGAEPAAQLATEHQATRGSTCQISCCGIFEIFATGSSIFFQKSEFIWLTTVVCRLHADVFVASQLEELMAAAK